MTKPLHLQQSRYKVLHCRVVSSRAQDGYAVNYWFIHDTENPKYEHYGTVPRDEAYRTRKAAVEVLTERLAATAYLKRERQ